MSEYFDKDDRKYIRNFKEETPDVLAAFAQFNDAVFASEGREIPLKYRELIALGVALTTQCVYCIEGHTASAVKAGASDKELAEAAWVAAALRAGGAVAHGRMLFKFAEGVEGHQH